mmetsp:Transcript_75685/g.146288  ORF Transcript_75685/g.146288 Transcript_75685/m.146288 type:complete len:101 (+) Transcript_75685:3-305(+)
MAAELYTATPTAFAVDAMVETTKTASSDEMVKKTSTATRSTDVSTPISVTGVARMHMLMTNDLAVVVSQISTTTPSVDDPMGTFHTFHSAGSTNFSRFFQ